MRTIRIHMKWHRARFGLVTLMALATASAGTALTRQSTAAGPASQARATGASVQTRPSPRGVSGAPGDRIGIHLRLAVIHPGRPGQDRARDADRKPAEVLAFFGVQPGMKVVDAMAGLGYYTEILARAVGKDGHVWSQNNKFVLERFAEGPLSERIERLRRDGIENVERINCEIDDPCLPGGVDLVLLNRFYHDFYWQKADRAAFNRAVFAALKPGGVYSVVDHHAEPGSRDRDVLKLHRVDAEMVEEEILAAGFVLDATSDILSHPEDTRDWNIFADNAKNRDRTDRFMYRFRKPER